MKLFCKLCQQDNYPNPKFPIICFCICHKEDKKS